MRSPPAAPGDRWGPRPALGVAAAGMGIGLLAPATATTTWVAVGGYGLGLGLASACTWVATTAVVSAAFEHRRAAALGLLAAGPARLGTGWLATPRTLPRLFLAGHGLVAAAFAAWALAGPSTALPVLIGVAVLFGAGYGAWLSLAPAILAATTDPRHLGRTLGTHATAVGIGGVVGPVLASLLLPTAPAVTLGGCAAIAITAALVLGTAR